MQKSWHPRSRSDRINCSSFHLCFLEIHFIPVPALAGSMVGMKVSQDNGHIIRAAMEGVGYDLMMGADLFREQGAMPQQCNLIGGGAHSKLWGEIIADMFESSMMRPKNLQYIGALGAALFAGVGTGLFKDFQMAGDYQIR